MIVNKIIFASIKGIINVLLLLIIINNMIIFVIIFAGILKENFETLRRGSSERTMRQTAACIYSIRPIPYTTAFLNAALMPGHFLPSAPYHLV